MVDIGDSFKFDGKDSLGHLKGQWNVRQLTARLVKQISREKEPDVSRHAAMRCSSKAVYCAGVRPVESSDSTVNGSLLTESWCRTSWENL